MFSPSSILLCIISVVPYCVMQTTILLFVFRIMFFQIRVFRELSHYGLVRVINKIMHIFSAERKLMCSLNKATRWQKADRRSRLPREHSNEVSVYRRAANEPNQGSSMQQVVQNASNSDSARKNITVTADAILVVIDVTIQIDQYKMQTDTKTITVKYTINFQYLRHH